MSSSGSFLFNLYAPVCEYFNSTPEPDSITITNYQAGNFVSVFSGSYISDTNGKYFSDYGISGSSTVVTSPFNLYINDNTHLSSGSDVQYNTIVYNLKVGVRISFYSASTITDVSSLSITDFILRTA